jgi:hypothetical protein
MRWPRTKRTETEGLLYVEQVVNSQGSIFRRVHQEHDIGIDALVEIVADERASGNLLALQIKSGDSYLPESKHEFIVNVGEKHIEYWEQFVVPVILVCYSPALGSAAWVSIRDHLKLERYLQRDSVKRIRVPLSRKFDAEALFGDLGAVAHRHADERVLIRATDRCLSLDPQERHEAFIVLISHPQSQDLRITIDLARRLLLDKHRETARAALWTLGYGAGRFRWSWNPNNREEKEQMAYAQSVCATLSAEDLRHLLKLVDDESFQGPRALGERLYDIIACSECAESVLLEVVNNDSLPMRRRANALYLLYDCNEDFLFVYHNDLKDEPIIGKIVTWMFENARDDYGWRENEEEDPEDPEKVEILRLLSR